MVSDNPVDRTRAPGPPGHRAPPGKTRSGNEAHTPGEILAYRNPNTKADGPGWRTRVVPNKFPALEIEGDLDKRGEGGGAEIGDRNGRGAEFGSTGPMERNGRANKPLSEEMDDEIPF